MNKIIFWFLPQESQIGQMKTIKALYYVYYVISPLINMIFFWFDPFLEARPEIKK